MKKIILLSLFFVFIIGKIYAQKSIHEFKTEDIYGNLHVLTDYLDEGKFVLLDFFTTSCVSCQVKAPIVDSVYRDFGCDCGDIVFIAMEATYGGTSTNEQVYEFCQEFGISFSAVSGQSGARGVFEGYDATYTPYFILISPDYEVVAREIQFSTAQDLTDTLANYGISPKTCEGADFLRYELIVENDTIQAEIDRTNKNMTVSVPQNANLNNCVSLFISSSNSIVYIGGEEQISGETENSFSLGENQIYEVVAENSNYTNNWSLTIEEANITDEIINISPKFYPNPANDRIFFDEKFVKNGEKIEIYNLQGKLVATKKTTGNYIKISDLQAGIYFLKTEKFSQKIVVNNH